jgi:hypothetical protein
LIGVHVDDLLIVASTNELISNFAESMRQRFSAITFHSGQVLLFLSMKITMSSRGIELDMANYTRRTI